jgi:tripartite-type tricarboxylate transporter receptor subunit TctC
MERRLFLCFAASAAALLAISSDASAQTYPSRPVAMIVPFAAGGPTDAMARHLVERMRRSLRQTIVVENITGADGSVGAGRVARAKPDGNTIVIGNMGSHD